MGFLNHVGITVSNLERSIEFYERLGFGKPQDPVFTLDGEWITKLVAEDGALIRGVFLGMDDGTTLELLEYQRPEGEQTNTRPNRDVGAMHVALNVSDLDGLYEQIKGEIRFNSEPQTVPNGPWAGTRVAYLNDPDGIPVELVQS